MLLKKTLLIFCLLFFQACHGIETKQPINAIIPSPKSNLKNQSLKITRSGSFQKVIQNIITGNNEPDKKYKQLKTEKPKPSGLFKLLENSQSGEIIFLTSLEPTQKYIDLLGNIEFLITQNHEHTSRVIFNLVDLENIILAQQRMCFDQFIRLSDTYQNLKQENENLKKNFQEKQNQLQNHFARLKQILKDEEEEQKKEPLLGPIFKKIQELQQKNSSENSEKEPNLEKWIENLLSENQNLHKNNETLTETLEQVVMQLHNQEELLRPKIQEKFLQEIKNLKTQIKKIKAYSKKKEEELFEQKEKNKILETHIQSMSQSVKKEAEKLNKTIEDSKSELANRQNNHLQKLTKKEDKQEQQLATYRFYSIFAGIGLFFSGFGLQWLFTYLTHK